MHPLTAGLGLKPVHYSEAAECAAAGLWFEVHPENYLVDGGPRLAWLDRVRSRHPLSFHSVALSLAGTDGPDPAFLDRLARLVDRFEPALVSGHLAWNRCDGHHLPDLLPVPRTHESLDCIVSNLGRVQDRLKRQLAVENPSHYLALDHSLGEDAALGEVAFLATLATRSGCALLVDVNNVHVSANNLGFDAGAWIDAVPAAPIAELHLAGHSTDPALGAALLVDSHDAPVAPAVWALYERLIERIGPRPTLVERDGNVPSFDTLLDERARADRLLRACAGVPRTQNPLRAVA
ncbi:MAG: DUF692 family multinuclear iron-containing protein [bacterium]|jgi:hypothetical protein|nr:DUF692 domain-containing protein [Betaproteobacteria bacterium]